MGGGDCFYLFIYLFIYRGYYFIYLWAGVVTLFTYLFFSLFLITSFLYMYILQALQIKVFSCREFNFKNLCYVIG